MTTYTNLGIKKIVTGDEAGTWGESTNTNFDYFDTAIVGYVSVTLASAGSSGSPNTLNIAEFDVSDGRNRIVEFVDAADLGGTVYVQITPDDFQGYYFIRNGLSGGRSILLFQGTYNAARDYEIVNGNDIVVRCSGEGVTSYIYNVLEALQIENLSVTSLTASTALALDANKDVVSVTNTGSGNNVLATSPTITTPTITTPTITGGTINNTVIGGTTAAAGNFTTVDTNNLEVNYVKARDGTASFSIADVSGNILATSSITGTRFITAGSTFSTAGGYSEGRDWSTASTLLNSYSFSTNGIILNAGSITNQYGFFVESSFTQATNNYGFYSNIASAANRWNFYAAGTAQNYFAGNTTFNTGVTLSALTASTVLALDASKNVVSATSTGSGDVVLSTSPTISSPTISGGTINNTSIGLTTAKAAKFSRSDSLLSVVSVTGTDSTAISDSESFRDDMTLSTSTTSSHISYFSAPTVRAAPLTNIFGFYANGCGLGSGASVTNQYGFYVNSTLSNATNNYGFYSDVNVAGGYNFYATSTASNFFGGNTIISVTNNTSAALRVTQLGTGNSLEIEDSTNPDATPFIVDASGRTIVGYTATVATKTGTAAGNPSIQLHGLQQQTVAYSTYGYSSSAALAGFFLFNRSKSGTIGTLSAVADGDVLGTIQWSGSDNDATATFNPAAYIQASCAGTVGTTSIPGRLTFWTTAASGTSPTQRISIEPTGYVGIGASPTSAAQLLDLRGSNQGATSDIPVNILRFTDTDTTTVANQPIGKIEFYNSDAGNAAVGAYILSSAVGASGGGTLRFAAAADAGSAAEICRVADTGFTMTKDTAGLGYGTGTGGAVTQATSRTTGVTLNKTNGAITLVSAAGTATWQSFTVTNSTVAATDVVILSQKSGTDLYMLEVTAVAAGSFRISFATTGGTTTEQPVFNFAVIKAVAA